MRMRRSDCTLSLNNIILTLDIIKNTTTFYFTFGFRYGESTSRLFSLLVNNVGDFCCQIFENS